MLNLPTILTTSVKSGPNGQLPSEISDMYLDAPLLRDLAEVNAWDNQQDFRAAVQATRKNQMVLVGIMFDICKHGVFSERSVISCMYSHGGHLSPFTGDFPRSFPL